MHWTVLILSLAIDVTGYTGKQTNSVITLRWVSTEVFKSRALSSIYTTIHCFWNFVAFLMFFQTNTATRLFYRVWSFAKPHDFILIPTIHCYRQEFSTLAKQRRKSIFQSTASFKNFKPRPNFVSQPACLPAVRPDSTRWRPPDFSQAIYSCVQFMNLSIYWRYSSAAPLSFLLTIIGLPSSFPINPLSRISHLSGSYVS